MFEQSYAQAQARDAQPIFRARVSFSRTGGGVCILLTALTALFLAQSSSALPLICTIDVKLRLTVRSTTVTIFHLYLHIGVFRYLPPITKSDTALLRVNCNINTSPSARGFSRGCLGAEIDDSYRDHFHILR